MAYPNAAHDEPAIITDRGRVSFVELHADPLRLQERVPRGAEVALRSDDPVVVASCIVTLEGIAAQVHLLPAGLDWMGEQAQAESLESTAMERSQLWFRSMQRDVTETKWVVYTSGTTGTPKAVHHSLGSLSRTVPRTRLPNPLVWGLMYDPNRMAGLQVLLHGLLTGSTVVAPSLSAGLRARVEQLISSGVTALSATPTLWRRILQVPKVSNWRLRQITLGGEIADQSILNALRLRFPDARITHVFASTETAAAFSVHDGMEGFPASYLIDPPKGIRLDVRDDILFVQNGATSAAGADGFTSTGDVVQFTGERVIFKGRSSGVVNVGGANVWPEQVEGLLRQHPDVIDVVVSSRANPLSGNLLVASVVPAPHADPDELRKSLRRWVRDRAPTSNIPAQVMIVESIDHSSTGKAQR